MKDRIKSIVYDCNSGKETYTYFTDEEFNEILAKREEEEKNRPLTNGERLAKLEEDNKMLESCILELAELLGGA